MDPADYDVRLTVPARLGGGRHRQRSRTRLRCCPARRCDSLAAARRSGPGRAGGDAGPDGGRAFAPGGADRHLALRRAATCATSRGAPATGTCGTRRAPWWATASSRDTVAIHSFYRPKRAGGGVGGGRRALSPGTPSSRLSAYLWPYPWPQMTSMEGVLTGGGMEYPMMTLMQPWADTLSLAGRPHARDRPHVVPHAGGVQRDALPVDGRGLHPVRRRPGHACALRRAAHRRTAQRLGARAAQPLPGGGAAGRRHGAHAPGRPGSRRPRTSSCTTTRRRRCWPRCAGSLGEETFHRAFREYGRRWIGRHPYPEDFFNTMDDVAGRDLSWFWRRGSTRPGRWTRPSPAWRRAGDSLAITVEDRGLAPMPVLPGGDPRRRLGAARGRAGGRVARRRAASRGAGGGAARRGHAWRSIPRGCSRTWTATTRCGSGGSRSLTCWGYGCRRSLSLPGLSRLHLLALVVGQVHRHGEEERPAHAGERRVPPPGVVPQDAVQEIAGRGVGDVEAHARRRQRRLPRVALQRRRRRVHLVQRLGRDHGPCTA